MTDSEAYQANLLAMQKIEQDKATAYIASLAGTLQVQKDLLAFQQSDAATRAANEKFYKDRIARQDDERTAEARRIANATEAIANSTPDAERLDRLMRIASDLIAKRVTSTSIITGAGATSKASAVNIAADAKAILAELMKP